MRLILRAFRDPLLQRRDFRRRERAEFCFGRRHHFIAIGARHTHEQFTFVRLPRHDRTDAIPLFQRILAHIEPHPRVALFRIGAVALKTFLRKDRADVAIELQLLRSANRRRKSERRKTDGGAEMMKTG